MNQIAFNIKLKIVLSQNLPSFLLMKYVESIVFSSFFNYEEPQKIILDRYHGKVRRGRKLKVVEKTDDAFYIPLLESLQQLLNDEAILEQVKNKFQKISQINMDNVKLDMLILKYLCFLIN